MGWLSGLKKFAGAVAPLNILGTGLAMGDGILGYAGDEADRKSQESENRLDRDLQLRIAEKNFRMQEDMARQGVRWRVADAEAAGLHPLAALGVMPSGSSPVSVMTGGSPTGSSKGNLYRNLTGMGQNISRAMLAGQSADERAMAQAQLEKVKAETDYVNTMAANARRNVGLPSNPPLPDPYSGVTGGDIRSVPNMHQVMRGPNGYEVQWSDAYARAQMSRPFSMAGHDLLDIVKDAFRAGKDLSWNLGNRSSRSRGALPYYSTGGR